MLKDVVSIRVLDGYRLWLTFEDGVEGVIDVEQLVRFEGVFAPLIDAAFFAKARVDPELGTVCWPNGADLDPDSLYSHLAHEPIAIPIEPKKAASAAPHCD